MRKQQLSLRKIDSRRYEVSAHNKFGLAIMTDEGWEVSPNVASHKEAIIKRITELQSNEQQKQSRS